MQQDFGNEDFEPAQNRDKELTLGHWQLAGLGGGLLLICALCFGLGYHAGRGSMPPCTAAGSGDSSITAPQTAVDCTPSGKPQASTASASPASAPATVPSPDDSSSASSQSDASSASTGPTVQVAAISRQEDAEVLLNALRKRGYPASITRDPNDDLLHVRVGPFSSAAEANKWKQKLQSNGYNAVVQP
jgi:DedD protein